MAIKDRVVKQAHEIYLDICRYQQKSKPSREIPNLSFRLQHLGTAMSLTKFQNNAGQTEKGGAWVWGVCLMLMLATMLNYMDRILLNQAAQQIKIDLDFSSYIWINGYGGSSPADFNYGLLEGFLVSALLWAPFFLATFLTKFQLFGFIPSAFWPGQPLVSHPAWQRTILSYWQVDAFWDFSRLPIGLAALLLPEGYWQPDSVGLVMASFKAVGHWGLLPPPC